MQINEVGKRTGLTKKAVEYYTAQGLLFPAVLENGYRDFSETDVKTLEQISVLRRLGISTTEIKTVLGDETGSALQKLCVSRELHVRREQAKKEILEQFSQSRWYDQIHQQLKILEQSKTVTEKLLEAFPGYFGRLVCMHFARFLNEPITNSIQKSAYEEILDFLDTVPMLTLSQDAQAYLIEYTKEITIEKMDGMLAEMKTAIENPDVFLSTHKEFLDKYLEYKQSDAYKNSTICKIQNALKEFYSASGYYDRFIPAMKKLSHSYAAYMVHMEIANVKLLAQYPEC